MSAASIGCSPFLGRLMQRCHLFGTLVRILYTSILLDDVCAHRACCAKLDANASTAETKLMCNYCVISPNELHAFFGV